MAAGPDPRPLPPALASDWALFLDVDGTLLDFAPTPDAVRVADGMVHALQGGIDRLGGALALVSGRPLAQLDALFAPLQFAGAGLHGLERRYRAGAPPAAVPAAPPALAAVRQRALQLADQWPGVLIEDKGPSLALHWRRQPAAEAALRDFAAAALPALPGYRLQPGNHVVELRPGGADKGNALVGLLGHAPFRGRLPVFVGDDLTDEAGFAAAGARGGFGVLVGPARASRARFGLPTPAAVLDWLGASSTLPR